MDEPAWLEKATILRGQVGSGVHGIAIQGTDDRDEMGICVEPPEYVIGLKTFEQYTFRTQPEGVRSGPGDLDLTVYSLRKWARLALRGNPSILVMLFLPHLELSVATHIGYELRANAHMFLSRVAGGAYLGYLQAQRARLIGERGGKRVHRPELEAAYGFDTKYAGHIIRLGLQGVELLSTGRLTLPMPDEERRLIRAIRMGQVPLHDVLTRAGELETEIKDLTSSGSPLPKEPDYDAVNRWLEWAYYGGWRPLAKK